MLAGDRLLVVADNCTDDTAAVAALLAPKLLYAVILRSTGKGYALDFGIKHLGLDPPEIVIIIDADCKAADGAIDRWQQLALRQIGRCKRFTLMTAPDKSPVKYHVAEFAWRVKNWVGHWG